MPSARESEVRFMVRLIRRAKSWCARIGELAGKAAAKLACLGQDFLSRLLVKGEHQFLMFKRTQVGYIVLVENENYRSGWPKHIHDSGTGFDIEFLATDP